MNRKVVFTWILIVVIALGLGFTYLYTIHGGNVSGGYIITEGALIQKSEKYYILFGNRKIEISGDLYREIEVDEYYDITFSYNDFFHGSNKGIGKLHELYINKGNKKIELYKR